MIKLIRNTVGRLTMPSETFEYHGEIYIECFGMQDWSDIVTKSKAVGSDAPPLAPGSIIISVQCTPLCVTEVHQ